LSGGLPILAYYAVFYCSAVFKVSSLFISNFSHMKKLFFKLSFSMGVIMLCLVFCNTIYKKYFYLNDAKKIKVTLLFEQDSLQYVSDVLYYGESSNSNTNPKDTCLWSISDMIDTLTDLKVNYLEKGAVHAKTYLNLIKNIDENSKVKTIIVTLNTRSFGSPWIHSKFETNTSQANVMFETIPPILKRMKLSLNAYDQTPEQMRNMLNEKEWQTNKLNVPDSFPYKTVRQWDNAMGNGTYLLPNGEWDMPKIGLACNYIKSYAFQINANSNPRIKDFDEIVKIAKQKKLRLIFNLLAENVEYADSLVGKELVNIMYENKQFLLNRYRKDGVMVVDNFDAIHGIHFTDQNWTTEHYDQTGRWMIAKNIVKVLNEQNTEKTGN
jgi:hypothetical protein